MSDLPVSELQHVSLREQAARFLRTSIVTGAIEENRLYSVGEFAERLGVSATPVREAVGDLAAHGLVKIVRNRGFLVPQLSDRDLDQIFQLRMMLEVPAVEAVAGHLSAEDIEECRELAAAATSAAGAGDLGAFLQSDRDFHLRLVSAFNNPRLVEIVERLRDQTRLYGLPDLASKGRLTAAAEEHLSILDAVERGDANLARERLQHHLQHTRGLWVGRDDPPDLNRPGLPAT